MGLLGLMGLMRVMGERCIDAIEMGRREIAEGPSGYRVKIRKLLLFVGGLCNVLILKWYVIAAKKA